MAREVGVCDECCKNCLLIHYENHDFSPVVTSFFKVMFGKKFDEVLIAPPKFSKMFASLKGKNTYLEDSNGHKWDVTLSVAGGSLAIRRGWNKFCRDHRIDVGDLLVFHYIKGSHFIVQIYGRSGCVKTCPGEKSNKNKRPKTTRSDSIIRVSSDTLYEGQESPRENGSFSTYAVPHSHTEFNLRKDDVVAGNVLSHENGVTKRARLNPVTDDLVELFKSTGFSAQEEDDRAHRLNLSAFELPDLTLSVSRKGDMESLLFDPSSSKMSSKKVEEAKDDDDDRGHLLNLSSMELPFKEPGFARKSDGEQFLDACTSEMTEVEVEANVIGKFQLGGNACSQVSRELHNAHTGGDSIDPKEQTLNQENGVVAASENVACLSKIDCNPPPISSPSLGMPSNPIMLLKTIRKSDTSEPLASSGYSQPPGKTMRIVKQEPREFGQGLVGKLQVPGNNTCSQVSSALRKIQTGDDSIDTKKRPLDQGNVAVPSKKNEANLSRFECSCPPPISTPSLGMPSTPIVSLKTIRKSNTFGPSALSSYSQPPDATMRIVKQEPREFGEGFFGANLPFEEDAKSNYGYADVNVNPIGEDDVKINNIVKPEIVDFCDAAPAPFIRITCLVPPDIESFLELPEPLPMKGKQNTKLTHRLVFLRNSAGKDWPVVYHDRCKVKVLASGWDAFRKANNIRPGDECAFAVENIDKGIFRVQVLNS